MIAGLSSWLATMKTPFFLHANNLTSSELIGIATKTENDPVFAGQNSSRRTRATHYSGPTFNAQLSTFNELTLSTQARPFPNGLKVERWKLDVESSNLCSGSQSLVNRKISFPIQGCTKRRFISD
jgi:hypothetical protein